MIFPSSFIILEIYASDFCIFWFIGLLRDLVFGLFISSAIFLIYSWLHAVFIFIKSILLSWLVLFYCLQLNFMPSSHGFCYEWLLLIDIFRYSTIWVCIFLKLFHKDFFLKSFSFWFPGFRDFYIVLLSNPFSSFDQKERDCEVAQSYPTLYDPTDSILPGSSVHGIFQARVLEWVAISFSRGSSGPRDWTQISDVSGKHFTIWATREEIR